MRKKLMNNLGLKILAFLAAVTLWFLVVNIDDPVTDRTFSDIPVTVINDSIVTDANRTYQIVDGTQKVDVTVTATRSELSRISAEDIQATADMRELTLGTQVPIQISIEGHTYEAAYSTPRNLQVQIEEEARNNFPITPTTIGTVREGYAEGYSIGDISCEPQELLLSGDGDTMKDLDEIEIPESELELSGLTERTEHTVDITEYLPEGVTLVDSNASNVVVTISVNQPGAQVFEVSTNAIVVSNLAEGLEISYGSTVDLELQIRGPEETLDSLSLAKKVSIDLKDYTEAGTYTVPVSVELPEDCRLVNDVQVEVVLREASGDQTDQGNNNTEEKE